jgi:MFS family permease
MTKQVQQFLNDKKWVRWSALVLLAMAMFFGYIFMDVLSPLQSALQITKEWTPSAYGHFAGSETFLNVFVFFLIIAGIILDKMGVRFTAILSGTVMVIGAAINYYALTESFANGPLQSFFTNHLNFTGFLGDITPFFDKMPASAKFSAIGFMIFGCGVEMAGITVSRGIVKWFAGKEMALAMGIEMALARVGVAVVFIGSPLMARVGQSWVVERSVGFAVLLLIIGLISFIAYSFMDKKLEKQIGNTEEKDDPFKVSDLKHIFSSKVFWVVAILCVLYYSAIFPFQKYAANMLQCTLGISVQAASLTFAVFPLGAAAITPFLGNYLDKKGKGATMLIFGALLMIVCHLTFAIGLPALRGNDLSMTNTESIISGTIKEIKGDSYSQADPIVTDVVFRPAHFYNPEIAQAVSGKTVGETITINPRAAFTDPQDANDTEKTAEGIVNLLNNEVDFKHALNINNDFQLTINRIQEPANWLGMTVAFLAIILLGISFSLVPASLWPSVPKLVDGKLLGSAYAVIFWIQNIGLYAFPMIIGGVLMAANPGVNNPLNYNYTWPMLLFASLGILALIFGLILKAIDAKRHYGLELPNIKVDDKVETDGME